MSIEKKARVPKCAAKKRTPVKPTHSEPIGDDGKTDFLRAMSNEIRVIAKRTKTIDAGTVAQKILKATELECQPVPAGKRDLASLRLVEKALALRADRLEETLRGPANPHDPAAKRGHNPKAISSMNAQIEAGALLVQAYGLGALAVVFQHAAVQEAWKKPKKDAGYELAVFRASRKLLITLGKRIVAADLSGFYGVVDDIRSFAELIRLEIVAAESNTSDAKGGVAALDASKQEIPTSEPAEQNGKTPALGKPSYLGLNVKTESCKVSRCGEKYAHIQPIKLSGDAEWTLFQALFRKAGGNLTEAELAALPSESPSAKRMAKNRLNTKLLSLDVEIPHSEWRLIDSAKRNKEVAPKWR